MLYLLAKRKIKKVLHRRRENSTQGAEMWKWNEMKFGPLHSSVQGVFDRKTAISSEWEEYHGEWVPVSACIMTVLG